MHIQAILNRVQKHKGFVYGEARLLKAGKETVLEVSVRPRKGRRAACSGCGRKAAGYDVLAPRRPSSAPAAMQEYIDVINTWDPRSNASQVNANAGRAPVRVDARLMKLLVHAREVSELSGGAFDVTFPPLGLAWNLRTADFAIPSDETIAQAIAIISDASYATGCPPGQYDDGLIRTTVHPDGFAFATDGEGYLAGSVVTMEAAVRVAVKQGGIALRDAIEMATRTPAAILGLEKRKGRVARGYDADLVLLDKALRVKEVVRAGRVWEG